MFPATNVLCRSVSLEVRTEPATIIHAGRSCTYLGFTLAAVSLRTATGRVCAAVKSKVTKCGEAPWNHSIWATPISRGTCLHAYTLARRPTTRLLLVRACVGEVGEQNSYVGNETSPRDAGI